jgi:hypothetical protein
LEHNIDIVQDGIGVNELDDVAQNRFKIQRRDLEIPFPDQVSYSSDYVSRPLIVVDNVLKDGADLF